jgi:hypothetical protein
LNADSKTQKDAWYPEDPNLRLHLQSLSEDQENISKLNEQLFDSIGGSCTKLDVAISMPDQHVKLENAKDAKIIKGSDDTNSLNELSRESDGHNTLYGIDKILSNINDEMQLEFTERYGYIFVNQRYVSETKNNGIKIIEKYWESYTS